MNDMNQSKYKVNIKGNSHFLLYAYNDLMRKICRIKMAVQYDQLHMVTNNPTKIE